ncbi:unnamed protein product [Parnassius mnemosyne]|uniref:Fibronectin type 3 and ankyrin repeat domains protein 1 n=1 Tax=Parnassius mnemosyne TaxID=213953 RepID=A0AAV1LKK7_9NEOP
MDLEKLLSYKFKCWKPPPPKVTSRSKCDITLTWTLGEPFGFLGNHLLYKLEKQEKIPPWVLVYSGGKTMKTIGNLAPLHPHKFRLKVILKASAVSSLVVNALNYYGDAEVLNNKLQEIGNINSEAEREEIDYETNKSKLNTKKWLETQWSEELWTNTDTGGASAVCFCMAVRCGYVKQLQTMVEERPELKDIASTNGLTPLAIAILQGDINTVRFLLQAGADVNLALSTGQTPLHLAVLEGHLAIIELLLEKAADFQARDINGLRVEHYAVDSRNLEVIRYILEKDGDVKVRDSNGWTPLFRAICQGADTEIIEELISRGSCVNVTDRAGLTLAAAARLLKDNIGRRRDSVLRLVDARFPHEKVLAHFTRITKKISSVHSMLK